MVRASILCRVKQEFLHNKKITLHDHRKCRQATAEVIKEELKYRTETAKLDHEPIRIFLYQWFERLSKTGITVAADLLLSLMLPEQVQMLDSINNISLHGKSRLLHQSNAKKGQGILQAYETYLSKLEKPGSEQEREPQDRDNMIEEYRAHLRKNFTRGMLLCVLKTQVTLSDEDKELLRIVR